MDKRRDISEHSEGKLASGLRRGAVVSGVTAAMAAASLAGVPNADATCVGISGININFGASGECNSTFGNFALVLGTGTATTGGSLNAAIAVGTNVDAIAGTGLLDSLNLAANFGNATDGASSTVTVGGTALLPSNFNLAANLGGNAGLSGAAGVPPVDMDVSVGDGFLNVALNVVSNRSTVSAGGDGGFLNFAINSGGPFSFPQGSDSTVRATGNLSAALNSQTFLGESCSVSQCGNRVPADGPLSLAVAAGVVRKLVEAGSFDITLANSFNSGDFPDNPDLSNVLAARGTQGNGVQLNATGNNTNGVAAGGTQGNRSRLNSTGNTNALAASGTQKTRVRPSFNAASHRAETSPGGPVQRSVSDSAKNSGDPASRGTSGLARNAKADADSTDRDK
jgi:hypothetical protein